MNELHNNSIQENQKKKLRDNLEPTSTILEYELARIYISYNNQESFEYTNLEGFLCLITNRKYSCLLLRLYEFINFNLVFEIELYTNIDEGYYILDDVFHCIEYDSCYIGLNFENKFRAQKMKNSIFSYSIIYNSNTKLYKIKDDNEKDKDIMKQFEMEELNIEVTENIIEFFYNEKDVFLNYNKNEIKNIPIENFYIENIETQKYKIKNILEDSMKLEFNKSNKDGSNKDKFIEFNSKKRKSIFCNKDPLKKSLSKFNLASESKEDETLSISEQLQSVKKGLKKIKDTKKESLKINQLSNYQGIYNQLKQKREFIDKNDSIEEADDDWE